MYFLRWGVHSNSSAQFDITIIMVDCSWKAVDSTCLKPLSAPKEAEAVSAESDCLEAEINSAVTRFLIFHYLTVSSTTYLDPSIEHHNF